MTTAWGLLRGLALLPHPVLGAACRRLASTSSSRTPRVRLADVPTRGQPRSPSSALKSARVALRKRFGQHLLKNADVVKNIVEAAYIQPHETAFEIGPGTGNMTVHLLEKARVVYAVELDQRLHAVVMARAAQIGLAHKFQCVRGDFLEVPLPAFDVMVANIPYQISSPVLRRLFAHTPLPKRAVILMQKEFADRLVAKPSTADYCRLSVNTQLLCGGTEGGGVRILMKVGREQFRPPPKVDSAVAEITPLPGGWPAICAVWPSLPADSVAAPAPGPLWSTASANATSPFSPEFDDWDCFLRIAFGGKNKTLRSLLSNKNTLAGLVQLRQTPSSEQSIPSPVSSVGMGGEDAEELPRDSDSECDEDSEPVDVVADAPNGGGVRRSRYGPTQRAAIVELRTRIFEMLASLQLSDKRPNALRIVEYQVLYRTLVEKLGLRFKPTIKSWGADVRRQRDIPAALMDGSADAQGAADVDEVVSLR